MSLVAPLALCSFAGTLPALVISATERGHICRRIFTPCDRRLIAFADAALVSVNEKCPDSLGALGPGAREKFVFGGNCKKLDPKSWNLGEKPRGRPKNGPIGAKSVEKGRKERLQQDKGLTPLFCNSLVCKDFFVLLACTEGPQATAQDK